MADTRSPAVPVPGLDGPQIAAPTPTPLAAPQVQAPTSGLSILSQGLNNFFGDAEQGADAVRRAVQSAGRQEIRGQFYLQRAQIDEQNKQRANQAEADALAGTPMSLEQANDRIYADTYAKTAGTIHGRDMFGQWMSDVYQHASPGQDLGALTHQWLQSNYGKGTGNPAFDAAALSHFYEATSRPMLAFQEGSAKAVIAQGQDNQDTATGDLLRSNKLNPDSWASTVDAYRRLDPMNPQNAPLHAAQALTAAAVASGDPQQWQQAVSFLEKTGSGVNGRSFKDSFPEAYGKINEQANRNYVGGQSLDASKAWSALEDRMRTANKAEDWMSLIADANKVSQQYGGDAKRQAFINDATTGLDKFVKTETAINSIGQMAVGKMSPDQKVVDAYLPTFLQRKGWADADGNVTDPLNAGTMVAQLDMIPSGLKAQMSQKLGDPSNPTGQIQAYQFFKAAADRYGDPQRAKSLMSEDAKAIYDTVSGQVSLQGAQQLPQIFTSINQNLDIARQKEVPWAKLTGDKTDADAKLSVGKEIDAVVGRGSWLTSNPMFPDAKGVTLDPVTRDELINRLGRTAMLQSRGGNTDWKALVDQTMANAAGQMEILPGMNGSAVARLRQDNIPASQIPLAFSVPNPNGGAPENTVATYRADLGKLSKALPGIVPDTNAISVARLAPFGMENAANGIYWLNRNGSALQIAPGQRLTDAFKPGAPQNLMDTIEDNAITMVPGGVGRALIPTVRDNAQRLSQTATTLSTDPAEAQKQLAAMLPQDGGWVLTRNPVNGFFFLGYRPRFAGPAPVTIDQKATQVTPEKQETARQSQQMKANKLGEQPEYANPAAIQ